ncbi:MAG: penicillin-binding transpeptidase domain-containing protein [Stappiaceae bacterium]
MTQFTPTRATGILMIASLLILSFVFETRVALSAEIERAPHRNVIADRTVTFLARDLESGTDYILEGSNLSARHTPWSTFKIPNLLLALETGVAPSLDARRTWNKKKRPAASYWPQSWRQDQTLKSAFVRSAVWYFQDLALEIGVERYRTALRDWQYGNHSVSDGSDSFWLDRTLQISVLEQVSFLENLIDGELGVSPTSIDGLLQASLANRKNGIALHGKTGAGPVSQGKFNGEFEGWYSGFVMRPGVKPVVFSLFVRASNFTSLNAFRKDFAVNLLKDIQVLPSDFP